MAPNGWAPIRIGDVCTKIGSGATPRGGSEVYLETGPYTLIRSQNVHNDGFHRDGLVCISESHAAELSNVEVERQDVLLNITGDSVARCCQVDESILPARVNQHVAIIRPDPDKLVPRFLRYFLVSPGMQARLLSWAGSGGTRNALTKEMIKSFDVLAPESVDEQRAIAHILGTLDDKIELNRRMNETLETMARAVFKSWFVDFDPVRAKAEGRDTGLPQGIADLFPDSFEESELGEIPAGWNVRRLDSMITITKGRSYKSSELQDSDTALVTLKSFQRGGGYRPDGLKPYTGEYKNDQVVTPGELVVAQTDVTQQAEVIGKPALVRQDGRYRTLVASLDTAIARPRGPDVTVPFLYCLMRTDSFQDHIYAHSTGTTVLHLAKDAIPTFQIACPPREVMKAYTNLGDPVFSKINAHEQEAGTLAAIRDILLPMLISGELRVPDGERIIGSDI